MFIIKSCDWTVLKKKVIGHFVKVIQMQKWKTPEHSVKYIWQNYIWLSSEHIFFLNPENALRYANKQYIRCTSLRYIYNWFYKVSQSECISEVSLAE